MTPEVKMKSQRIPIDDKNYTVVGINGFRQGNLTREQAESLARRMQEQMVMAGWAGKMRIYYRDGSEVLLENLGQGGHHV